MAFYLPYGKYSLFVPYKYYKDHIDLDSLDSLGLNSDIVIEDYLLRITYQNDLHNDKSIISNIVNNTIVPEKYFSFPEGNEFEINKQDRLVSHLLSFDLYEDCVEILKNENRLSGIFIKSFGDIDLFDSINKVLTKEYKLWEYYTLDKFIYFMKQLSSALHELHKLGICHFDIKPENIRVDSLSKMSLSNFGNRFRLIDFGFSEKAPFVKYRSVGVGTNGYSTIIPDPEPTEWLPYSIPNDWIKCSKSKTHIVDSLNEGKKSILNENDLDLFYKSDIYSLGRTFYHLLYFLNKDFNLRENRTLKYEITTDIIRNMVKNDVNTRFSTKKMYMRIDML
jgi:serine/threonine protein kinase